MFSLSGSVAGSPCAKGCSTWHTGQDRRFLGLMYGRRQPKQKTCSQGRTFGSVKVFRQMGQVVAAASFLDWDRFTDRLLWAWYSSSVMPGGRLLWRPAVVLASSSPAGVSKLILRPLRPKVPPPLLTLRLASGKGQMFCLKHQSNLYCSRGITHFDPIQPFAFLTNLPLYLSI